MKKNSLNWKIGGAAGFGIMATGMVFAKACTRGGLDIFDYAEYPSLIRGGHNTYQIRIEEGEVRSHGHDIDLLVALNMESVTLHADELAQGAGIIYDPAVVTANMDIYKAKGFRLFPVPLIALAKERGEVIMQNMVALGASCALVKYPFELLDASIQDTFSGKKNSAIAQANSDAARAGYAYVEQQFSSVDFPFHLEPLASPERKLVITGNEALALGAIQAGCKLYVAYPMSPSSSILHTLAQYGDAFGVVVKHAEDEISVANMAIGAGWAGVRSMLGTSGGGFALMVEALGLAGITETPVVMVNAQRPGPATGLPTWTEQSDLRFVIHAAQGEFPRFVLAPGDIDECFSAPGIAFNLAEKYQTPVIILLDKYISESHGSPRPFDITKVKIDRGLIRRERDLKEGSPFPRYEVTPSGISPRTLPGTHGGLHIANSDEHDAYGYTSESSENRTEQMEKRLRKVAGLADSLPQPQVHGPADARVTIIGWGSTKGAIRDAAARLEGEGITVRTVHIMHIWPFPAKAFEKILHTTKHSVVVENNATGQLFGLIREMTGHEASAKVLKFDGRPFHTGEIVDSIHEILTSHA